MAVTRATGALPRFVFGDFDSDSYQMFVSAAETYNAPVQDIQELTIPGRMGSFLMPGDRYENIEVVLHVGLFPDRSWYDQRFDDRIRRVNAFLLAQSTSYKRLQLFDVPGVQDYYYRLGILKSGIEWTVHENKYATADLVFSCRPEKFLLSGEEEVSIASGDYIWNPTEFKAKPLISFDGYGELQVGNDTLTIAQHSDGRLYLDCEIMTCYNSSNWNENKLITLDGYAFPTLGVMATTIYYSGLSDVKITPRWYEL